MLQRRSSTHVRAALLALFVTFLWSTSFILIKVGLQQNIPPLIFAGLRYTLAFLVLLPLALLSPARRAILRCLSTADWLRLAALGVIYYAITQGTQFIALDRLPSATVSLFLNFSAVTIALLSMVFLKEYLTGWQWAGVVVSLVGAVIYLHPIGFPAAQVVGVIAVVSGMLANSVSSVLGRAVNRSGALPPLIVTAVSMGIGALLMLALGLLKEGWPVLTTQSWLLIAALALVNTALAFTLWNLTLQVLSAAESSVINNTMLIQIAVLAWLCLGEALDGKAIVGLLLAALGTLLVQLRRWPGRQVAPTLPVRGAEGGDSGTG